MNIIIIGCGRWGSGLAQDLSLRGHGVTVVDQAPSAFERLGPSFKGKTLAGVGFDRDVLLEAGIERADGLAVLTGSDEANVVIARVVRQVFQVPRVVARLYDPRKAEIYRRLGLQSITPLTWGVHRMTELLGYSRLEAIASLGSGTVEIVEVEIPPSLAGRRVKELTIPGEAHVVAISRSGTTFLPTPGTTFQEGDLVHLSVLAASSDRIREVLGLA
jgi:trk system potassium uptake protein TrkA